MHGESGVGDRVERGHQATAVAAAATYDAASSRHWSPASRLRRLPDGESERRPAPQVTEVLLVEDSASDAALIRALIVRSGAKARVSTVASVAEAERKLPGEFDVILLDLELPDERGVAALRRVVTAAGDIPVVVLTGVDDADLPRICIERGAQDYVCKHDLGSRDLRRAIDYARARARSSLLERRLEHSDRLAAIGQLAATVAHEVNNPAAFVRLNTEDLLQGVEALQLELSEAGEGFDKEHLRTWLEASRQILVDNLDGVDRVARLVRDLRSFAKAEDDDLVEVDVSELCRSTINVVANHVRHRAELVVDYAMVPPIYGHPRRLGQVVINLVVNAAQAIKGPRDGNEVRVETRHEGDEVVIHVSDTGCGVPIHLQQRIFEPFYSTKSTEDGTGLGLPICVEIVESLGGRLECESTPGQGSCFSVWLPARGVSEPRPPGRPDNASSTSDERRLRILMIDDESRILDAFARGLSRFHDVVTCEDCEQALALLERPDTFDVITCDLMMPGVDGPTFYARAVERFPELASRIMMMTGGATTDGTREFLASSNVPVLTKPISLAELRHALEALRPVDP